MTPMEIISPILFSIASSAVIKTGKTAFDWLLNKENVVSLAAKKTQKEYDIDLVSLALESWTWSPEFRDAFENLYNGKHEIADSDLIESFRRILPASGNADEIEPLASDIIHKFVANLRDELLKSSQGPVVHAAREEALHATTHAGIESIDRKIDNLVMSVPTTGSRDSQEDKKDEMFNNQLDVIKDILKQDRFESARPQLNIIAEEASRSGASKRVMFRIATGLASCAIRQGDVETAITEYKKAYTYAPDEIIAISNRAYAALLEENLDGAQQFIDEALLISSNSVEAAVINIAILDARQVYEEIDSFVAANKQLLDSAQVRLILGHTALRKSDYLIASDHLAIAIELDQSEWRSFYYYSISLLGPIQAKYHGKALFAPPMESADVEIVEKAISALDSSITLLEKTDLKRERSEAYANRAAAKALKGDIQGAESDCMNAIVAQPDGYLANRNAGIIALEKGDYNTAASYFGSIENAEERAEITLPYAVTLLRAEKPEEAINVLEDQYVTSESDDEIAQLGILLIQAFSDAGKSDKLLEMLEGVEQKNIGLGHKEMLKAEIYRKLDDHNKQQISVDQLVKQDKLPRFIGLYVADFLYDLQEYSKAAKLYGEHLTISDPIPLQQRHVISLYNSQQAEKALDLAQKIRARGQVIPVVSEIEAFVLEYYGQLESALELYEKLSNLEPKKPTHNIHKLECLMRLGKAEDSKQILESILTDLSEIGPDLLIHVSKLQLILSVGNPLSTLYEGLRRGYDNPQIQLSYLGLLHSAAASSSEELLPLTVDVDSVVILKENDQKTAYAIVRDSSIAGSTTPINPESDLGRALLGKRKGDTVQVTSRERGAVQDRFAEITVVLSKYVYAFQQIGATFETRFMGFKGFQRIDISDNDLTDIKMMVKKKHLYISTINEMYNAGKLTLGACAAITGDSIIDVWGAMVSLDQGYLKVAQGSGDEANEIENSVSAHKAAVLDLTSILTIVGTENEGFLSNHFEKVYIPQSVVDEIEQERSNHQLFGHHVGMVVGMRDGEYVKQELTDEDHKRQDEFYDKLLSLCRSEFTEIVAPIDAVDINSNEFDKMCETLGRSSVDAILLAKEKDIPLYSDDLHLRQHARTEHTLSKFIASPYLLSVLHRSDSIGNEEYYRALQKLVLSNYTYVRIPTEFLKWLLEENQMRVTPIVEKVFGRTFGPLCDLNAAVNVASAVIKHVWLSSSLTHLKAFILDFVCRLFRQRPDGPVVLVALEQALRDQFQLYTKPLGEILPRIRFWSGR